MNETTLVGSRWRYVKQSNRVPTFLDALGIEYRKVPGQSFWQANKEHLLYLYRELQYEARGKMRELHPDTGGNEEQFKAFIESFGTSAKQFARHGVLATLKVFPARKNRGKLLSSSETTAIERLIRRGLSNREIRGKHPASLHSINGVRQQMPEQINCACGRRAFHNGMCFARRARRAAPSSYLQKIAA